MTALIGAVLVASLLGSMHCAGMCGAFLAFAVASPDNPSKPAPRRWRLIAAYNGGRLVTYSLLGAISGAVGAAVNLGGSAVGLQRAAAVMAGGMMIGFGLIALFRVLGVRVPRAPLPGVLRRTVAGGHRLALSWPPVARALTVGLLTTLLPCGWLYAFVITSAGTGHPGWGALTMAAFWLGTLPIMASLGAGLQALTGPLRSRLPLLTSLLLVGVGVYTLAGRMTLPAVAASDRVQTTPQDAAERVRSLNASEMPCCQGTQAP